MVSLIPALGDRCRYPACFMQFKTKHLLALAALIAIALWGIDAICTGSARIKFSSPVRLKLDEHNNPFRCDFGMAYETIGDGDQVSGFAMSKFGYQKLLRATISESNVSTFGDKVVEIKYRKISLPYFPQTRVQDVILDCFDVVMIFPSEEEWKVKVRAR